MKKIAIILGCSFAISLPMKAQNIFISEYDQRAKATCNYLSKNEEPKEYKTSYYLNEDQFVFADNTETANFELTAYNIGQERLKFGDCHTYTFSSKGLQLIAYDELTQESQKEVIYIIVNKMRHLQETARSQNIIYRFSTYDLNYYTNDVFYYQNIYNRYGILHKALELSLDDKKLFESNLKINILADYAYNGDSGEGYYAFAYLFSQRPEWVADIYKHSKDALFKENLQAKINSGANWQYALGYSKQLFVDYIESKGYRIRKDSKPASILGFYKSYLLSIDKNWNDKILLNY